MEFRHAAAKWCPHFLLLTYDDSSFPCHLSQCRLISRHLKRRQFQLRDASRAPEVYLQLNRRAFSSFVFLFYDSLMYYFAFSLSSLSLLMDAIIFLYTLHFSNRILIINNIYVMLKLRLCM